MKALNWSATSVLDLLKKMEDSSNLIRADNQCPLCCEFITEHAEDCQLAWHIKTLEREVLDKPGKK